MVAPDDEWIALHILFYEKMLADLKANPPRTSPQEFLRERAPQLLGVHGEKIGGYRAPDKNGLIAYDQHLQAGEHAVYWNGASLNIAPLSIHRAKTSDYAALGKQIMETAGAAGLEKPLVIDLGAGSSMLAVGLRAAGCDFPFLGLDLIKKAIEVSEAVVAALELKDVAHGLFNINESLAYPRARSDLRDFILQQANGRPIIIASRWAIFPFYSVSEYQRLFDFLINDIGVRAGVHLEMCGHLTAAYRELTTLFGGSLPVGNKLRDRTDDFLAYLESRPELKVHQRAQLWPQYISHIFSSYLSWIRR